MVNQGQSHLTPRGEEDNASCEGGSRQGEPGEPITSTPGRSLPGEEALGLGLCGGGAQPKKSDGGCNLMHIRSLKGLRGWLGRGGVEASDMHFNANAT